MIFFFLSASAQSVLTKVPVTPTVTPAPSPKSVLHITDTVVTNLKNHRRLVATSGIFFSPHSVSVFHISNSSPPHLIFNQSGCEALPGCCSNVTHPAGGNFQSRSRHSISQVVITEYTVCSPSSLRYYLSPAQAEASPPPHENPITIQGHTFSTRNQSALKLNYSVN